MAKKAASKKAKKVEAIEPEVVENFDEPDEVVAEKPAKRGKKSEPSADTADTNVYKYLDLIGVSEDGIEQAIQVALDRAAGTIRHIDWFEVKEVRGKVVDGKVDKFQVHFRAGFKLE